MNPLERRYRALLRLLPASYRDVWEEQMVATFLETMETGDPEDAEYLAEVGRPSLSEKLSVLALAVRLRLGGIEAPPRSRLWGDAVRRAALVVLLVYAVAGTVGVVQDLWIAGVIPWPPVPESLQPLAERGTTDLRAVVWGPTALLWLAAYFALLVDSRRTSQVLAGLALLPGLVAAVGTAVDVVGGGVRTTPFTLTVWADLLVGALLIAALAAFHRDAPDLDARRWLRAYPIALALAMIPAGVFLFQAVAGVLLLDWPGLLSIGLVVVATVHVLRSIDQTDVATRSWSLALALLAAPVLLLRVASLLDHLMVGGSSLGAAAIVIGVIQALGVAATAGVLRTIANRTLRELPSSPPRPATTVVRRGP